MKYQRLLNYIIQNQLYFYEIKQEIKMISMFPEYMNLLKIIFIYIYDTVIFILITAACHERC